MDFGVSGRIYSRWGVRHLHGGHVSHWPSATCASWIPSRANQPEARVRRKAWGGVVARAGGYCGGCRWERIGHHTQWVGEEGVAGRQWACGWLAVCWGLPMRTRTRHTRGGSCLRPSAGGFYFTILHAVLVVIIIITIMYDVCEEARVSVMNAAGGTMIDNYYWLRWGEYYLQVCCTYVNDTWGRLCHVVSLLWGILWGRLGKNGGRTIEWWYKILYHINCMYGWPYPNFTPGNGMLRTLYKYLVMIVRKSPPLKWGNDMWARDTMNHANVVKHGMLPSSTTSCTTSTVFFCLFVCVCTFKSSTSQFFPRGFFQCVLSMFSTHAHCWGFCAYACVKVKEIGLIFYLLNLPH